MGLRKSRDRKRARRPREHEASRDDERTRPDGDLDARLDAVTSRFTRPPTAEELRAAFGRKPTTDDASLGDDDFTSRYPTETLFSPTADEPEEAPKAEDRSRTTGDYYYDPDDAWDVLGLAPGASWSEIAAAHRRLAMEHHPDRLLGQTPEERAASEAAMRDINVAYTVLRRLTGH